MLTVGIDEVGRGCWAGPLVAGAVILKGPIAGLKDSKLLSKSQRERLAAEIRVEALAFGLGWVNPGQIDKYGLTQATALAMRRALRCVQIEFGEIIIDGNVNYLKSDKRSRALVNADNLVPAVSAASIIAKVARDKFMCEQASKFPNYGFEKHVGYGTSLHQAMLKEFGVCRLHRQSFKPIKSFVVSSF